MTKLLTFLLFIKQRTLLDDIILSNAFTPMLYKRLDEASTQPTVLYCPPCV